MLSRESRSIALMLLGLAAGTAALVRGDEPRGLPPGPPSTAAQADDAGARPAPGRMFVAGRVRDARGNPVPGAAILVQARSTRPGRAPFLSRFKPVRLGGGRADGLGRFRFDALRTSSTRHEDFLAVAMAPGHGIGWVMLDPDSDQPEAEISLRPEQVIHGRVFDVQGRPVPGVAVSVTSIQSDIPRARASLHDRSVHRRVDAVSFWSRDVLDDPAWPRPSSTDAEGRFTVRGVGRNLKANLAARHPRFAPQLIEVATDDEGESKAVTAALVPPQIVNVRVTYADTGRPVPRAPLWVASNQARVSRVDESETDADGRTRINSWPTERGYGVTAYPPEGEPYLVARASVNWPKGALEQTLDIVLPRGIEVRGKVTEAGSGRPVAGARVDFTARQGAMGQDMAMPVHTGPDGTFRLGAEPKPGYLIVRAPEDDLVFQAVGSRLVLDGRPGGTRLYSHAYAALDLKPGMGSQEVNLTVRRGVTVRGRVVGPDGQPVGDAWIFSRLILDPSRGPWTSWAGSYHGKLRNGQFEVGGFDPDAEESVPVYFLEPERKLGAVVNLSARSAARGPVTVRLEPCGSARAWLVDPEGKPITKLERNLSVRMVMTPGPVANYFPNEKTPGELAADEGQLETVDPINYPTFPAPEANGRLTLPVLIPGALYRVVDFTMYVRGQAGPELGKAFTVEPGQKLNLGDVRVARPSR